jgi:hypothetical protein
VAIDGRGRASSLTARARDWKKITEVIGHSDVRTTYNRYGKVVPEDLAPFRRSLRCDSAACLRRIAPAFA